MFPLHMYCMYVCTYHRGLQHEKKAQLIVVDYMSDVRRNCHALSVEGVLNTLQQLYQLADGQDSRPGHWLPLLRMEVERRPN